MKLTARIEGNFNGWAKAEISKGKQAISQAVRMTGTDVKDKWRGQIAAAGFAGNVGRLQRSIRQETYPKGRASLNAATTIYPGGRGVTNLMAAVETGTIVRSENGFWLAIPLPAAGAGRGGKKLSPGEWERKKGRKLDFVYLKRNHALLVDKGQYLRSGVEKRRGKWSFQTHAPGYRKGDTGRHKAIFILVPQVRLRKRLNVYAMAGQVAAWLPARVVGLWRD